MSVRAMSSVWELDLPDSDKIVLLALADCANDEGHCWPGMKSLVIKCSKSERTIQGCIKRLVDQGHLTRREVVGKGCNYTVHPNRSRIDCAPAGNAPPQGKTQTPAAAADKPSGTINTEAKASYTAVVDLWNELSKASGIPAVRVLNNSRKQMIAARVKEHGLETMLEAVRIVHASKFCRGGDGARRKADIMYILQPKTLARALEGYYGGSQKRSLDQAQIAQNKRDLADHYDLVGRADEAAALRREAAALVRETIAVVRAA